MYKIIGADGKEYGPVSAEQLRQWIREGRVNAQTRVLAEGLADWRALGELPDFTINMFGPPPPLTAPLVDERKSRLAAGLLGIFLGGLGVHRFYLGYNGIGIVQLIVTFVTCGAGALWGFIEGILILTNSILTTDAQERPLKD